MSYGTDPEAALIGHKVMVDLIEDQRVRGLLMGLRAYGILICSADVSEKGGNFSRLPEPSRVFLPMRRVTLIQDLTMPDSDPDEE